MLSVNLDAEAEQYLVAILSAEKTNSSELIKRLLRTQWLALNPGQTFLERRGAAPQNLLNGPADLSDRAVRKQAIADYLQQRHQNQHS